MDDEEFKDFNEFVKKYNISACNGWKTYVQGMKQISDFIYINAKAILNNIKIDEYHCPR